MPGGKLGVLGPRGARIETSDLVYVAPVLKGYCETQLRQLMFLLENVFQTPKPYKGNTVIICD